jgi:hypothetical protein
LLALSLGNGPLGSGRLALGSGPMPVCSFITSKNAHALQYDLESITRLVVARKSIDTLDIRGFEINYYVMFLN